MWDHWEEVIDRQGRVPGLGPWRAHARVESGGGSVAVAKVSVHPAASGSNSRQHRSATL